MNLMFIEYFKIETLKILVCNSTIILLSKLQLVGGINEVKHIMQRFQREQLHSPCFKFNFKLTLRFMSSRITHPV